MIILSCIHTDTHAALQDKAVNYPEMSGANKVNHCPTDISDHESGLEEHLKPENLEDAANEIRKKGDLDLSESDLEDETDNIQMKFKTLVTRVLFDMKEQELTPEDIAQHLERFPALEPVYADAKKPLLDKQVEDIRNKATMTDVFRILSDYYSWFNYDLIENLIQTFCTKCQDVLQEFKKCFFEYSERRVFVVVHSAECSDQETGVRERIVRISEYGSDRKHDVKYFILKMDKRWNMITVKQLRRIRKTVAGILKVKKHTLYLQRVEKGCCQMTFLIPEFVAAAVFPLQFPTEQKAALLEADVIELHCDGYDLQLGTITKESRDSDSKVYPASKL